MRQGRIAPYLAEQWAIDLENTPTWVGLATSDPFAAVDPLTVEVPGISYARVAFAYERLGALLWNELSLTWLGIPAMTNIAAIMAFDAAVNGNLLWVSPKDPPWSLPDGGALTVPADSVFVGFDLP